MKKGITLVLAVLACTAFVAGCATTQPVGVIYTEVILPVSATSNGSASPKVGTSECTSVLSIVATGDCSIEAGKQDGGITRVHHVDWDVENILGIIATYTVTVYGE